MAEIAPVIAVLGSGALWLTYLWLLSAIVASYLSRRKGYGEQVGLASGLILSVIGAVVWLFVPAKPDSSWKIHGPLGRRKGGETVAEARARMARRREGGGSETADG